jgi:hypothetical protein
VREDNPEWIPLLGLKKGVVEPFMRMAKEEVLMQLMI